MKGQRVAYVRVSTVDQNTDNQLVGIEFDKKFVEYASAKNAKRPQLETMINYVREGDLVIVHSLDRLARNIKDLLNIVETLNKKSVTIQFLRENLVLTGTDSPLSNLLLSMFGSFAEFERNIMKERQMEGIKIAKEKGLYAGRKPMIEKDKVKELQERHSLGITKSRLAKDYGMSKVTLYKYLRMIV